MPTTTTKSNQFIKHIAALYAKAKTSLLSTSTNSSLLTSLFELASASANGLSPTTITTLRRNFVADIANANDSNNVGNSKNSYNHNNDYSINNSNNAYVSNLLKRIKRLAQPRILRVKSSHTGGLGSGYNRRNKEFRFGKFLIVSI